MRRWLAVPTDPIVTVTLIVVAIATNTVEDTTSTESTTSTEVTTSTASTVIEPSSSAVQVVASVDASFCLELCVSSFVVVRAPRIQLAILPFMSSVDGALLGTISFGSSSLFYVLLMFLVAIVFVGLLLTFGTLPVGFHLVSGYPFLDLLQGAFMDVMCLFEAVSTAFGKGVEEDIPYILPG